MLVGRAGRAGTGDVTDEEGAWAPDVDAGCVVFISVCGVCSCCLFSSPYSSSFILSGILSLLDRRELEDKPFSRVESDMKKLSRDPKDTGGRGGGIGA